MKMKYDKDSMLESIQRVHNHQANLHSKETEKHEHRLKLLEEMEAKLIGNL